MTDRPYTRLIAVFFIIALAVVIYWPSLGGEFVVDDRLWATLPAPPLSEVLSRALFSWGFNESATGVAGPPIFRPVSNLITGLEHWAFGQNPLPYRLAALMLHILNTLLVLALLARLFPGSAFALRLWGALLFLVHPALVESVAWISATAELFMTTFVLAAVLCFLRSVSERRTSDRAMFALFALAAILSKEAALALPLLLALVQFFRGAPIRVPEILGTVAMVAAYLVWRQMAISHHGTVDALVISPARVLEFALAHLRYLVLPAQQPFSISPPGTAITGLLPVAVTVALLVAAVTTMLRASRDGVRALALGAGWIGFALWPAYAVALVGDGYFAGRHAYLPAVGLVILATALAARLPAVDRRIRRMLAVASIAVLSGLTLAASGHWASNLGTYQRASVLSPQANGPWAGLAFAHLERDQPADAVTAFRKALERVRDPKAEKEIRYGMALALASQGQFDESSRQLERITQLDPRDSSAWNGLGNNAWASGRLELAERYYREALRVHPNNQEARANLASVMRARPR